MPPYQYIHGTNATVYDTASASYVPISEPAVQAAIAADEVLPAPAPAVDYAGRDDLEHRVQTNDGAGQTQELIRLPLTTLTVYSAIVLLEAIDSGNGALVSWYCKFDFKRLNGGALSVGGRQDITAPNREPGAAGTTAGVSNWNIAPSLSGNDAVISVTGQAGRTVDWFAFATVRRFRPGGLA